MGKPRMTQRDKWKKRPCVLRYHAFRDKMRHVIKSIDFDGVSEKLMNTTSQAYGIADVWTVMCWVVSHRHCLLAML